MSRLCLIINLEQPYNGINEKITNMNFSEKSKTLFLQIHKMKLFQIFDFILNEINLKIMIKFNIKVMVIFLHKLFKIKT